MRSRKSLLQSVLFSFGFAALAAGAAAGQAQAQGVLATGDTNVSGVVAEVVECKVKEGVLTVKIRLRNTGNDKASVTVVDNREYDKLYLTAGSKKYFILRDSERTAVAPACNSFGKVEASLDKGGSYIWWAKYPAPPDSETKIIYIWPLGTPIEDVPISR